MHRELVSRLTAQSIWLGTCPVTFTRIAVLGLRSLLCLDVHSESGILFLGHHEMGFSEKSIEDNIRRECFEVVHELLDKTGKFLSR